MWTIFCVLINGICLRIFNILRSLCIHTRALTCTRTRPTRKQSRIADPSQRENLGIIVQYKVKVKLCIGGPILGGWVKRSRFTMFAFNWFRIDAGSGGDERKRKWKSVRSFWCSLPFRFRFSAALRGANRCEIELLAEENPLSDLNK